MHPDHDTAARLAREYAAGSIAPLEAVLDEIPLAAFEALLEGYAAMERMREALLSPGQLDGLADWMLKRMDLDNDAHALTYQILRQKADASRAALPSAREGEGVVERC